MLLVPNKITSYAIEISLQTLNCPDQRVVKKHNTAMIVVRISTKVSDEIAIMIIITMSYYSSVLPNVVKLYRCTP